MAEQTDNYGLTLPDEDDFYNVEDFNGNMDKIDTELKITNDKLDNIDFAILEDAEEPPEPEIPTDSDLLGGKPGSYYEALVQAVSDRVTANLNNINAISNNLAAISYTNYLEPGKITDLNFATMTGIYRVALEFTVSSHPPYVVTGAPSYGMLEVKVAPSSAWIWQIYYPTNSSDIYIRTKANEGNWTAWALK